MDITRIKSNNENRYDYEMKQDNKILRISFGGNLDLYWNITNLENNDSYEKAYEETLHETFLITTENYYIYSLFEELINDVIECNVFEPIKEEHLADKPNFLYQGIKELYKLEIEKLKRNYRYTMLYDGESIEWLSDEEPYEIANTVKITKLEDNILLEFIRPPLKLKEQMTNIKVTVGIRFRNSGSRYNPFNVVFMRMYNKLQNYNPDYHQIHLEETYHQKQKVLKQK